MVGYRCSFRILGLILSSSEFNKDLDHWIHLKLSIFFFFYILVNIFKQRMECVLADYVNVISGYQAKGAER